MNVPFTPTPNYLLNFHKEEKTILKNFQFKAQFIVLWINIADLINLCGIVKTNAFYVHRSDNIHLCTEVSSNMLKHLKSKFIYKT